MKNSKSLMVGLALASSFLFFAGCHEEAVSEETAENAVDLIANTLCGRVADCTGVTVDFCREGLSTPDASGETFSLDVDGNELSVDQVADMVGNGGVEADAQELDNCLEALAALSCDEVDNASEGDFEAGNLTTYPELDEAYPTLECEDVFQNTDDDGDSGDGTADAFPTEMEGLISTLCSRIWSCTTTVEEQDRDQDWDQDWEVFRLRCEPALLASANLADDFGYPTEEGETTLQEIVDAERSGEIILVGTGTDLSRTCQDLMSNLSCDEVVTGYDPDDSDNFENVENFIPEGEESCDDVYASVGN